MNTLRRIILAVYLALFAALSVTAGLYFVKTREEYTRLKTIQAKNRHRLEELEHRLSDQQETLKRLRTDPAYVELIIRRNLHYAKPDEAVFQFDN